jgi:hypothetical protein
VRLLTAVVTVSLLAGMPVHAAPDPADVCEKDVYIYFDVSGSMYDARSGVSTLQLFTLAIEGLLRREDFLEARDRVAIVAFAESAATLIQTEDAAAAALVVQAIPRSRAVLDPTTGRPAIVGDRNRTNLTVVLDDVMSRLDPSRRQIFIIVSDFAHDPDKKDCRSSDGRIVNFRTAAQRTRDAIPRDVALKVALLTAEVADEQCGGGDQSISIAVKRTLREVLQARDEVRINPATNIIANRLRQVLADPVTLEKGTPSANASRIAVKARNPNPFPISISQLALSLPDGRQVQRVPLSKTIGCGAQEVLEVDVPLELREAPELTVGVTANTPPVEPLRIPSERVTITQPEVHVFEAPGKDTYAIELEVEKSHGGEVLLKVHGVPGAKEKTYRIDTSKGRRRVALALPGNDGGSRENVRVTTEDGRLLVEGGNGLTEEVEAHGSAPADHGGEHVPFYLRWLGAITGFGMLLSLLRILPGKPHQWWHIFHKAHEFHVFTSAIDWIVTGLGISAVTFSSFWPYGRVLPMSVAAENFLWAASAGSLTLFIFRAIVLFAFWRSVIERHLLAAKRAVARRTFLAIVGLILSITVAAYVFMTLTHAFPEAATFVHPVDHPS